jgi:cardiolipin synthase
VKPTRLRAGLRRHGLVRRPEMIRSLVRSRRLRFTEGNQVELFDVGHAGLDAMLEAIGSSRGRIHLETYILRGDDIGRRFLSELTRRAQDGVDVRLLYDSIGSLGLEPAVLAELVEAGGEVLAFNPIGRLLPGFAPRRRDHRKILVVDGNVAFAGGLNIGDEYAAGRPGSGRSEWRDAHVRLVGPVVRDLEAVFLESWFRADGPGLPWDTLLGAEPAPAGDVRCAVLADGPAYRHRRMQDLLVSALESARSDVLLESPYFAPGRRLLDALSSTSRRGVAVELLLAGRTDHPILQRAARSILPRLLSTGVRVHEYQPSMLHSKLAVFDAEWAIIGSSNLDRQSLERNFEVNLIIEGGDIPRQLRSRFRRELTAARRIDAESLAARSLVERVLDRIAALLLLLM